MSFTELSTAFETLSTACVAFDAAAADQEAGRAVVEAQVPVELANFITALTALQNARAAAEAVVGFAALQAATQTAGNAKADALSAYTVAFEAYKLE